MSAETGKEARLGFGNEMSPPNILLAGMVSPNQIMPAAALCNRWSLISAKYFLNLRSMTNLEESSTKRHADSTFPPDGILKLVCLSTQPLKK